jgi:hypothetical protein
MSTEAENPSDAQRHAPVCEELVKRVTESETRGRRYLGVYPAAGSQIAINDAKSIRTLADEALRKKLVEFLHHRIPEPADRPILVVDGEKRRCWVRPWSRGMEWVTRQKGPAGVED